MRIVRIVLTISVLVLSIVNAILSKELGWISASIAWFLVLIDVITRKSSNYEKK